MSLKEATIDEEQHSHDSASTDEGAGVFHRGINIFHLNVLKINARLCSLSWDWTKAKWKTLRLIQESA
jgi:hypothetical protein